MAEYETIETTLRPGDRLWILSDGISESADQSGAMLGEEATGTMLCELSAQSPKTALDALMWHLAARKGSEDFEDDISAILWQMSGSEAAQNPLEEETITAVGQ